MKNEHDKVVAVFNELGYQASFAAVARRLKVPADSLYRRYPSREALGAAWLEASVPSVPRKDTLKDAFGEFVRSTLHMLQQRRDFARAWLAAMKASAPLHETVLRQLHAAAQGFFVGWLDANEKLVGLPDGVRFEDVEIEIADALAGAVLALVLHWEADRSSEYRVTQATLESVACLLDAALIRRPDFGGESLLVHLHRILALEHERLVLPLLDALLKPERARRLADPVNLVEALRLFRLPTPPA